MTRVCVLGTGGAGLVAAVAAADAGAEVTLVEKGSRVGGTTALSGGTTWLPAVDSCGVVPTPPATQAPPAADPRDDALAYLDSLSHGLIDARLAEAFVDTGPEFLAWIQDATPVGFHVVPGMPDYHPEHPGGRPKGGRSFDPDLFRMGALGEWADRIVMPERTPRLMLTEVGLGGGRGLAPGTPDRARRKAEDWRGCGHALVGGLLHALLTRGVEPRLGTGAVELLLTDDAATQPGRPTPPTPTPNERAVRAAPLLERAARSGGRRDSAGATPNERAVRAAPLPESAVRSDGAVGAVAGRGARRVVGVRLADGSVIGADAVVIATGGFEWDSGLVDSFLRGPMTSPASVPTNTGDGLRMAMAAGAALGTMREAWWVPTVEIPGEERPRLVLAERTRPGSIMVNRDGRRFTNEAANYNALGGAFHQFDPTTFRYANLPCWLVFDDAHLRRYGFLSVPPGAPAPDWCTTASTLDGLGELLGLPGGALAATVGRFNAGAADGVDPDFGRGVSAYDGWNGDLDHYPSPGATLGPLTTAPFHAVPVHSGCLGTKGGPRTTVDGQVRHATGGVIDGLYAAGNAMAGTTGMVYGGAGGTLGPAMVFGYRAGRHAAGVRT